MTWKPWRIALVGFGAYAESGHIPAYLESPLFDLRSVTDPVAERRESARRLAPKAVVFRSFDELMASGSDMDIVDICSPPEFHFEQAMAALQAGKHVICEKPVVTRIDLLKQLQAAASRNGCRLWAAHNYRFAPAIRRFVELAHTGTIGTPTTLHIDVCRTGAAQGTPEWRPDWRKPQGILMDHGPHVLSIALWLARERPREVRSEVTGAGSTEVTLWFSGMEATIRLSWTSASRRTEYRMVGTDGEIELRDYDTLTVRRHGQSTTENFTPSGPQVWTQTMLAAYGAWEDDLWQVTETLELAATSSTESGRSLVCGGILAG